MKTFPFYDRTKIDKKNLLFPAPELRRLMIPVILEQLLNSLMGMMDTVMVSYAGSEALSAVSLVDSINVLVIQVFAALATGGTIICSQYLGRRDEKDSNRAARQVTLTVFAISTVITVFCLIFHRPLLRLIFGQVDTGVMEKSITYFLITAISFPCIALFNAGSAFFRAGGNSRFPMQISVTANVLNIVGNAALIYGFHLGVAGAATSTLISRAFSMAVVFFFLRRPKQPIVVDRYFSIRPDFPLIAKILAVGIPSGIENGMFQLGKLLIQSSVSTLGTDAISAQAVTAVLEMTNGIVGIGIGIGLMTVVGQCVGAGRKEEAKYYIVKMTGIAWVAVTLSCLLIYAATKPITLLTGMSTASAELCLYMMGWITVVKPIVWTLSFVPGYGLRAAGDVRFSMLYSVSTMFGCRVLLAVVLIRFFGFGPIAVWIGMFGDWTLRAIGFTTRFFSGKWLNQRVV